MPGIAQPQLGAELAPASARPCGLEEPEHADGAAELADQPPGPALAQPVEVAADLVGPGRDLEAERDRRARLTVGPPDHHRVAVRHGHLEQRLLDRPQVAPGERARPSRMTSANHVSVTSCTVAPE